MIEPRPRWGDREEVDQGLVDDWRARLASRYPPAAEAPLVRAWAGLYDVTPDAHPIIGPAGDAGSISRAGSRATASCRPRRSARRSRTIFFFASRRRASSFASPRIG